MTFKHKLACRLALLKDRRLLTLVAALAAAAVVNCERTISTTDPITAVARVSLSPKTVSLQPNQLADFTAVSFTAAGDTSGVGILWRATAGVVSDTGTTGRRHYGRYHNGACGSYRLIASNSPGWLADTASIAVVCQAVASVDVTPPTAVLQVGQTAQLAATPKDGNGNPLSGRVVTWGSSNTGVATASVSGLVTAVAAGSATITATSEGQSGTAAVTVGNVAVASVDVSPPSAAVVVGQTLQLAATPKDASGNPLSGRAVTWTSGNTAVATVSASGLVTAVAAGSATITASSEGRSGTAAITVNPPPVASVAVNPATASVQVGQTAQLTATPQDASGNPLSGRVVTWASSNTAIATVNASGLVSAVAAGSATITATSEGKSGSAAVTVTTVPVAAVAVTPASPSVQVGQTAQLTATPQDANGNPLSGRTVTWTSSNQAVATVNATGLVTGAAAGAATITATSEGKSGTAAVTVTPVPVASVAVTPASASIQTGGTIQLTATPKDANGKPLTGRTVAWTSANGAVATVSTSGLVTGVATGTTTITATSEGQSGTSSVAVSNAPVASVDVSPAAASLQVSQTLQLTATPKDANGGPLSGRAVTWASSNTAAATVGGSGLVTAVGAGAATITATSEGQSGASSITVTNVPVASVAVSPATASVAAGLTVQLTATPKDANGNPLSGRAVAWTSSNAAVATVDASGLVTAVAAGSATITATSEGQSGTAAISVTPAPVASVAVTPPSASVNEGTTVQLTATPKDANGNPLSGRVVTWASSNTTVATVSASGLVTGKVAGSATITATSEGQSGTSAITVVRVPVAAVTVTPASASVNEGNAVQLTATPKDANGTPLTGRTVTWASDNTTVATVSATGLVTGKVAGSATITATSEGQGGTAAITVVHVPVASVAVSPAPASVQAGQTVQLTATPKDASGTPLAGRTVTWASDNTAVATVSGSGLVSGVAAGSATIMATSEGQSGTSALTVSALGASVVLVGAGDIADCSRTSDDSAAALVERLAPDAVFTAGDNVYTNGTATEYANCYDPTWGRFKAKTHPAPGNHDYNTSGATGYYGYFGALAGDPTKGYYSYDLGAWHIIALNGEISTSAGSAQEVWLKADLAASTKTCTMAYIHRPRFSAGYHGSNSSMQPLWQDLYDAGAELYIAGHNHDYERFAPQDANGVADPVKGIREFVVGTGGAGSEAWSTTPPIANEEVWADPAWGVLKLTLRAGGYDWQFVPITGQTFTDSGSGTCH